MSTARYGDHLAAKLVLALVAGAVALAVPEVVARMLNLQSGVFLLPTPGNCLQRSRLLSLEFRPDCRGELFDTPLQTNSLGLRGGPLRDDGAARILAVGDSCTWGWRVGQDQSYPAVLQQLLDEQIPAPRYQVINAGVPGYTSYQGLIYLRERGLPLRPSIVVIAFGFNDAATTGDIASQLASEKSAMPVLLFDDFLLLHSAFYHWLRWRTYGMTAQNAQPRSTPEQYQRNMTDLVRLAREHGAQVVLLSFWNPFGSNKAYRSAVETVSSELEVPLYTYTGPRIDVVHPTVEGYRTLADQLLALMQREGYVPDAPGE
jgi:lysophospholipase L1-like esterase